MKGPLLATGLAGGTLLAWSGARMFRTRRADLKGKVALITGGSRGLGLQLARRLLREGCRVVLVARDPAELSAAKNELRENGGDVHTIVTDVGDRDAVLRMAKEVRARYGRLDLLINNASVIQVGPIENLDHEDFREAMAVNYWGTVHTTLAFLDDLKARGGRIVNVDSIGGRIAAPHLMPYTAAKFATYGFSEGLRVELAKSGVSVTTVVPGFMRTGSPTHAVYKGDQGKEFAWFAGGDATPLTAMSPKRAARGIVAAAKRRDRLVVLGMQAKLLRFTHDLMPGTFPRIFSLMDRRLPHGDGTKEGKLGLEVTDRPAAKPVARLLDKDAKKHNQYVSRRPAHAK